MMVDYERVVVLSPGGSARREVTLNEIDIPDLWHIAQSIDGPAGEAILKVWHLAHDFKKNLAGDTEPRS